LTLPPGSAFSAAPPTACPIPQLSSPRSSIEICLGTKPEIGLIHVLYFSTAFTGPASRVFLFGLLRSLPDGARALIFLGSDASDISLLVPSGSAEAAVVHFPAIGDLVGLDLSKFFFSKANEIEAERTVMKLLTSADSDAHRKTIDIARNLSQLLASVPIRVISIIRAVTRRRVDLEPARQSLVRLDFVVGDLNAESTELAAQIPGLLISLSSQNPALQAKHLIAQSSKFQLIFRIRANGCECRFLKPQRPFTDQEGDTVFVPCVPVEQYPIALEIVPRAGPLLTLQFLSKFIVVRHSERKFMLRIANFSFKATQIFSEYAAAVNWNCALWFWCRKVAGGGRADAVAAIFCAAGSLLKILGEQFEEPVLRAVCALPTSNLFAGVQSAMDLLLLSCPRQMKMIPAGRTLCQSVDGVAEERDVRRVGPSRLARELQMRLAAYVPIAGVVNPDCLRVPEAALAKLRARG
jgi:hypothetical protein